MGFQIPMVEDDVMVLRFGRCKPIWLTACTEQFVIGERVPDLRERSVSFIWCYWQEKTGPNEMSLTGSGRQDAMIYCEDAVSDFGGASLARENRTVPTAENRRES